MKKQCVVCNQKIIEKKEKWVRLTDFYKGKTTGEVFYHLECWRDRFNISNSVRKQKMYNEAGNAIGNIIKAISPILKDENSKKVYYIK